MSRVDEAISARRSMGEDFFGGWDPDDCALLSRHAQSAPALPDAITDYMGIRTSAALHPAATPLHGTVIDSLPIPDDSLRAETIEQLNVASFASLGLTVPTTTADKLAAETATRTTSDERSTMKM